MISSEKALQKILQTSRPLNTETIALASSVGRVLREKLGADRDFPPFDRVSMDGIAIQYQAFQKGQRFFESEGIQAAGAEQKSLQNGMHCMEVMTGAILPQNADTVIRYEDLTEECRGFRINCDINEGQNVHKKAKDRRLGDPIISDIRLISSAEIGVLATIGKAFVSVSKLPRTVIISTGDELVEVDEKPAAHQIRKSNVHMLHACLSKYTIKADLVHLQDSYEPIVQKMAELLDTYDLILMSGAVSKGKFDYVPKVLEELQVEKHFHRVSQRPGKPFWFGTKDHCTVFAFPGNPVSTMVCYLKYCEPWLRKSFGLNAENTLMAVLSEDVSFNPDLTYFMQAKIRVSRDGLLEAVPMQGHGSGDLANLVDVDAFIELPRGKRIFEKGTAYPFISFRN
jgi:molybdopterin molybdotransferase